MSAENQTNRFVFLFSAVGALIVAGILVLMNMAAAKTNVKMDLTEYNLHTLSDGTKNILGRVDTPVTIRFYATKDKDMMPQTLKEYSDTVLALLKEYQEKAPKDMVALEIYNPEPDTDDEDNARLNGIQPQMTNLGTQIYLGLMVEQLDKKVAMTFLDPSRDQLLEYDISRAIVEVTNDGANKGVIGLITGLPIQGSPQLPPQMQQQQRPSQPWYIYRELKRDYDVRDLSLTSTSEIPEDVDVLLIIHPNGISDETEYAIDQYVLRGGSVLAFLDPFSIVGAQSSPQQQPGMPQPAQGSDLKKLLPAWGIEFEGTQVIADNKFRTPMARNENNPAVLTIDNTGINDDDVVTNQIRDLLFIFSGAFYGEPKEGINQEILVKSSDQSGTINPQTVQFSPTRAEFDITGKEHVLAMRLTGRFKTAFPEGNPAKEEAPKEVEEKKNGDDADKKEEEKPDNSLKESVKDGVVVLIGDSDILYDQFSLASNPMFPQMVSYRNGNMPMTQNLIEQLAGDTDLISVRSRGSVMRPFTKINEMLASAEEKQRKKIKDLEAKQEEAQQKLNALQAQKSGDQRFILSPEQREELGKYNKLQAETSKELREVRKELKKDVTAIENRIRIANIAIIPAVIAVIGIFHAIRRRKVTSAR